MPPRETDRPRSAPAPAASVGRPRPKGQTERAAPSRQGATRAVQATSRRSQERGRPGRLGVLWGTGQLAALVLSIACTGALIYLLTANALTVQTLTIVGTTATNREEIAAGVGVMGNNIFTVEPQAAAERLAALPTVREATVWPELPDRLVVRITERQPVLIWQSGSSRFQVDERGVVMALNPPAERSQNLPNVTVRDLEAPAVGGQIDAAIVTKLTLLLRRAPEYGLPVAALDYSPQSGIVLHVDKERTILFGEGARLDEQLAVAAAVAGSESNWTVLNVTDTDRLFIPVR